MPFCSACGVEGEGDFCSACGKPRRLPASISTNDVQAMRIRAVTDRLRHQRYAFPALLSFFIPGLGQIIKGQVLTGALIMVASVAFGFLCVVGIGLVMLPLLWIVQLYDAYAKPDGALAAEAKFLSGR